jgi:DnaK suppressor protein
MAEAMTSRKHAAGAFAPDAPMPRPVRRAGAIDPDEAGSPELTPAQIEELKRKLEERRASLIGNIDVRRHEERDTGREVGDEMDEANIEGVAGMASKLLERDVQLLVEIDRALGKMRDGTYGLCEGTGEPIGHARLSLQPWARYSVAYQEEIEREQRTRGGV